jgi:hypothetical protein
MLEGKSDQQALKSDPVDYPELSPKRQSAAADVLLQNIQAGRHVVVACGNVSIGLEEEEFKSLIAEFVVKHRKAEFDDLEKSFKKCAFAIEVLKCGNTIQVEQDGNVRELPRIEGLQLLQTFLDEGLVIVEKQFGPDNERVLSFLVAQAAVQRRLLTSFREESFDGRSNLNATGSNCFGRGYFLHNRMKNLLERLYGKGDVRLAYVHNDYALLCLDAGRAKDMFFNLSRSVKIVESKEVGYIVDWCIVLYNYCLTKYCTGKVNGIYGLLEKAKKLMRNPENIKFIDSDPRGFYIARGIDAIQKRLWMIATLTVAATTSGALCILCLALFNTGRGESILEELYFMFAGAAAYFFAWLKGKIIACTPDLTKPTDCFAWIEPYLKVAATDSESR